MVPRRTAYHAAHGQDAGEPDPDAHLRGATAGLASDPGALPSRRSPASRDGPDRPVAVRALQPEVSADDATMVREEIVSSVKNGDLHVESILLLLQTDILWRE